MERKEKVAVRRMAKMILGIILTIILVTGIFSIFGMEVNAQGFTDVEISDDGVMTWKEPTRVGPAIDVRSAFEYKITVSRASKILTTTTYGSDSFNIKDFCQRNGYLSGTITVDVEAYQTNKDTWGDRYFLDSCSGTYEYKAPYPMLGSPQNLNWTLERHEYKLTWDPVEGASEYIIDYAFNAGEKKRCTVFAKNYFTINLYNAYKNKQIKSGVTDIYISIYAIGYQHPDGYKTEKRHDIYYYPDGLTISLDASYKGWDNVMTTKTATDGKLRYLPIESRTGYIFDGWYDHPDGQGGKKVTVDTQFKESTTIYAHWTPIKYSVYADGGEVIVNGKEAYEAKIGDSINVKAKPINSNFVFTEWEVVSGDLSLSYTQKKRTSFVFSMPAKNVQLRAKYNYIGGTIADISLYLKTPVAGESPSNAFSVGGELIRTSTKWYNEPSYISQPLDPSDVFVEGSSYRAHIELTSSTGTIDTDLVNIYVNGTLVEAKTAGLETIVIDPVFTATPAPCIVTFDNNGGKGEIESREVGKGSTIILPDGWLLEPPEGKVFDKWDCGSLGMKASGDEIVVNENMNIKAVWKNIVFYSGFDLFTVSFESNGGTKVASQYISEGGFVILPTDPVKDDHLFSGWYSDKELTNLYDFETAVNSDVTLYAKWSPLSGGNESKSKKSGFEKTEAGTKYYREDGTQAKSEWVLVDNKYYYINADGYTASDEWVDGYWINSDGSCTYDGKLAWKSNSTGWWVEDSKDWYPVSSWEKIDGIWYYFNSSGYMACNEYYNGYWFNSDGSWNDQYFLTWKSNSTGWWVEDKSGWWPSSQWLKIDGCWYYFDADGYMVTSQYIDGYWIGADGVCQ